jgi:hypothetical protein
VAQGLGHGLAGSYELLMMVIRGSQVLADCMPDTGRDADPLEEQAAGLLAEQLAADRVPSVRAIRAQLHVGQPGRGGCATTSPRAVRRGWKIPLREQLAGGGRQANGEGLRGNCSASNRRDARQPKIIHVRETPRHIKTPNILGVIGAHSALRLYPV